MDGSRRGHVMSARGRHPATAGQPSRRFASTSSRSSGLTSTSRGLEPSDGPDDAAGLQDVHQASGLGEADPQLALQHRGRAELQVDHQRRRPPAPVRGRRRCPRPPSSPTPAAVTSSRYCGLQLLGDVLDDRADLVLGDPGALHADRLGRRPSAGTARRPGRPASRRPGWSRMTRESVIDDGRERQPRGHVGLDQAGDHVGRRTLGGQHQVDAGGAGQLGDPDDRVLDVARGDHHQVGELVDDRPAGTGRAPARAPSPAAASPGPARTALLKSSTCRKPKAARSS